MEIMNFAVFTNACNPNSCTDDADWYPTCREAMAAAREAIESGIPAADVEVLAFRNDEVAWNAPITFDDEGGAWSEDTDALEAMGVIALGMF